MNLREIVSSWKFWERSPADEDAAMARVERALEKLNGQRTALRLETMETDALVRKIEVDARLGMNAMKKA